MKPADYYPKLNAQTRETSYKSALVFECIHDHPHFSTDQRLRNKTPL